MSRAMVMVRPTASPGRAAAVSLSMLVGACSGDAGSTNSASAGGVRATGGSRSDGGHSAAGAGGTVCPVGSERCACYGNDSCNAGLVCASQLCVAMGSAGNSGQSNAGSGGSVCPVGSERCACYGNSTCDAGLACASGICVDLGLGGQSGAGNAAGQGPGPGGSMAGGGDALAGTAGSSAGGSTAGAGGLTAGAGAGGCGPVSFDLVRNPVDVLLLLDRSASMVEDTSPTKWSMLVPALQATISATDATIAWGLEPFPLGEGSQCTASTYPSQIAPGIIAHNAAAMLAAIGTTLPTGNGTPTADAITEATKYLQSLHDGAPKYVLLTTDGEPQCNGMTGSVDATGARAASIAAVAAAAQAGIHTFVLGCAIRESATSVLNSLALAGLEARADPNPLATRYYEGSTQGELEAALKAITGRLSTCLYAVSSVPPEPNLASVTIGGLLVPRDTSHGNGWDYVGSSHATLEAYGAWCDRVKSEPGLVARMSFPCAGGQAGAIDTGGAGASTVSTGGAPNAGGASTSGGAPTGGVSSIALPFVDDFEDGNLDGWVAWNETLTPGIWSVVTDGSSKVLTQSAALLDSTWQVGGDYRWTDQRLEVRVKFVDPTTTVYLAVRFAGLDDYDYLQLAPGSLPRIRQRQTLAGAASTSDICLGSTALAVTSGTWYTMVLSVAGSTLSASMDGTSLCSGTVTAQAGGGIALGTDGGPASFDDLRVSLP